MRSSSGSSAAGPADEPEVKEGDPANFLSVKNREREDSLMSNPAVRVACRICAVELRGGIRPPRASVASSSGEVRYAAAVDSRMAGTGW